MRKPTPRALARGAVLAAAFLAGLCWAFPWDRLAESALAEASRKFTPSGIQLGYGSVRVLSHLPPGVEIRDLSVASLLGVLKAPSVRLGLRPVDSLSSLAPALGIESPSATLDMAGTSPLRLGRMQAELTLEQSLVNLDSIRLDGELSVSGRGKWSTAEHRLTAADLVMKAPAKLDPGLNLLALSTGLKPAGTGQWRLKIP
jgi:hypothetical protein